MSISTFPGFTAESSLYNRPYLGFVDLAEPNGEGAVRPQLIRVGIPCPPGWHEDPRTHFCEPPEGGGGCGFLDSIECAGALIACGYACATTGFVGCLGCLAALGKSSCIKCWTGSGQSSSA